MIMENNEDKVKAANDLYIEIMKPITNFPKLWAKYFREFGESNGMSYPYEVLKISDNLKDFVTVCDKIHARVTKRLKNKNEDSKNVRIPRRNLG